MQSLKFECCVGLVDSEERLRKKHKGKEYAEFVLGLKAAGKRVQCGFGRFRERKWWRFDESPPDVIRAENHWWYNGSFSNLSKSYH
jgi:hypothetical protein